MTGLGRVRARAALGLLHLDDFVDQMLAFLLCEEFGKRDLALLRAIDAAHLRLQLYGLHRHTTSRTGWISTIPPRLPAMAPLMRSTLSSERT